MRQFLSPKLKGHGADAADTTAQDLYASLTKRSWFDYMNTIGVPQENKLIDYATNPDTVKNAMSDASSDATGAFDRQAVNNQRRLSSLGLTLAPDEQAAVDRSTGLAKSLADVGAQNSARDVTVARQQQILSGANVSPLKGSLG